MPDDNKDLQEKNEDNFTTELFKEFKKVLKFQWVLIVILIAVIFGLSIYHEYQWAQFDAIVVDSDGGNANYVGNDGDVNNYGEDSSPQEEINE